MIPKQPLTAAVVAIACLLASHPPRALAQATPTPPACLSGRPDGTFQGDRPLTRNEFAAGMNACLPQMTPQERLLLLQPERANLATKDEFRVLIERQRELNQQLGELSDRVGDLANPQSKPATR